VRNLEREISSICRKVARQVVREKDEKLVMIISANTITKMLGPPPFKISQIEEKDQIGMVTGLAWTQVGGELLCVETLTMPGKGKLNVTGKLGDVMKESAQAAVSFVRSRVPTIWASTNSHKELDLHIHIPEGAIPKDGPSAGITMCTSLVSALTRPTGAAGCGHDRRNHPARAGAADRRAEGKNYAPPIAAASKRLSSQRKTKKTSGISPHPSASSWRWSAWNTWTKCFPMRWSWGQVRRCLPSMTCTLK
jgi:hypothetical protein